MNKVENKTTILLSSPSLPHHPSQLHNILLSSSSLPHHPPQLHNNYPSPSLPHHPPHLHNLPHLFPIILLSYTTSSYLPHLFLIILLNYITTITLSSPQLSQSSEFIRKTQQIGRANNPAFYHCSIAHCVTWSVVTS